MATQRLLRQQGHVLREMEDELLFIFDRSMMLEVSVETSLEESEALIQELRNSRLRFDAIGELPMKLAGYGFVQTWQPYGLGLQIPLGMGNEVSLSGAWR